MEFKDKINQFVAWLLFRVVHPLLRRLPNVSRKRHILLVSNGAQMVEHLAELWELFKDDQNLTFCLLLWYEPQYGELERVVHKLPIRIVGLPKLHFTHWDLVITADHLVSHHWSGWNLFSWPILRIPHGAVGKRVEGELYAFGSRCYDKNRNIPYTRIFVYSENERRIAIEMDPQFSEKIVVVGNLKSERLLEKSRSRDEIRHQLGISQDETLVFMVSTYGPNCLLNTVGDALFSEARRVSGKFRFALSIHPIEHMAKREAESDWHESLLTLKNDGFLVLECGEDWENYLVACDVILTDHTSLTSYGVALGKPYIYTPFPESVTEKHGLTWHVMPISPILRADASNLVECLMFGINEYRLEKLAEILKKLGYYPGEAKNRARNGVYDILYH